jgi:HSP20 family protein
MAMLKELIPVRRSNGGVNDAFLALREQMDHVFDEWFNADVELLGRPERALQFFSPRADVTEGENEVRVTLELPGMDRNQVEVEVDDGRLVVTGRKESKVEKKEERATRRERFYGSFRREFLVPTSVDPNGVKAKFDNGILEVVLPKTRHVEQATRRIEVR